MRDWIEALVVTFASIGLVFFVTLVVFASIDHGTQQMEARVARPEFGTYPPKCDGLDGVRWQECMGVGPK
jgi:hypothetical protein